jgi:hypothetical protein
MMFLPIVRVPSRIGPGLEFEGYSTTVSAPNCIIEVIFRTGGGTTTQVSVFMLVLVLSCGAPAKMSFSAVVPSEGGDRAIRGAAIAFVVDLPPTPENSTLTVVADAASAGPDFGTNRVLRPRALSESVEEGGRSLRGGKKSLDMGVIQLCAAELAERSLSLSFSRSGCNALSLILGANDGSRITSFSVVLI